MEARVPLHAPHTIGWIDEPADEGVIGPRVRIHGWALAERGVRAVEVRLAGNAFPARIGLPRADVADVHPHYPDNPRAGFEFVGDFSRCKASPRIDRRALAIVAIDKAGRETVLGRRSLIEASAHTRWRFVEARDEAPFHLLPALSGVANGGAFGLDTWYSAYASATTRIGMRVPILYLRTTRGAQGDYAFDPDFDTRRMNGSRPVADDGLAPVLAHAAQHRLPVLVTLNGGIWSDAAGTCAQWDLTDRLEEDVANCQWNERDEVMPDDWLTHLPGSQHAPELSRALTLNVHAAAVRACKRRNLQQAAECLTAFMRANDRLFVGVNLDPDVYVNPFFAETQWYDYNPGTLAQFREWLAGSGPYAGDAPAGAPDLRGYRRRRTLALADACALAGRRFARWDDVDPPRRFPRDGERPYWRDPWVREWEHFRRHLVALHYDELARWLVDAGIPRDRIWSSQGLMAPPPGGMPLALALESPVKDHDSGGVSIEGSKPRDGHLGVIVYGDAATNAMPMENERALYATLARVDPDFGVVEFNTADLRDPRRHPTYADAYRALRDLWNEGARFVSPMAWNGANGAHADAADYVTFTAWRNTPLEEATRDFLLARSGLPRGSRLWTFGTSSHADDDGWTVERGGVEPLAGALDLVADDRGEIVLVSPADLDVARVGRAVIGCEDAMEAAFEVAVRTAGDPRWNVVARGNLGNVTQTAAGAVIDSGAGHVSALRVALRVAPRSRITLVRIALLTPQRSGAKLA